jgi:hypothetical protein
MKAVSVIKRRLHQRVAAAVIALALSVAGGCSGGPYVPNGDVNRVMTADGWRWGIVNSSSEYIVCPGR